MSNLENTNLTEVENVTELVPEDDVCYGTTEIPNHRIIGIDTTKAKAFTVGVGVGAGGVFAVIKGIPALKHYNERRKIRKAEKMAAKAAAAEEAAKEAKKVAAKKMESN